VEGSGSRDRDGQCSRDALKEEIMKILRSLWAGEEGQDIAEYAVMLAVILVLVVGTIRLVGSNANNVFSSTSSALQ
jgi:Flp pilus assembly pilin Flp